MAYDTTLSILLGILLLYIIIYPSQQQCQSYSFLVAAGAKTVMVADGATSVDVLADVAMVDGVVPFRATSNQNLCRCCPPCPAVASRQTFRCRVAEA